MWRNLRLRHFVSWYWLMALLTAGATAVLWGERAAWSALAGGLAVAVPSTAFALALAAHRRWMPSATSFFLGELIKVLAILAGLLLAVRWLGQPDWAALLVGVMVTAKSGLLGIFLISRGKHGSIGTRAYGL